MSCSLGSELYLEGGGVDLQLNLCLLIPVSSEDVRSTVFANGGTQ